MRPSALNGIGLFREGVVVAQVRPFFVSRLALAYLSLFFGRLGVF